MADRGTTGGYPKIATVISADLSILGRLPPGAELRFKAVSQKPGTTQVSIKGLTLQGDSGLPEIPLPPGPEWT